MVPALPPWANACQIYETRPSDCTDFLCLWLQHPQLGPEWFPHRSKIVVVSEDGGNRIAVHVDPSFPLRWREEPYFGTIKKWAVDAAERRGQVIVYIKDRAIVVLPNKEIDLGKFGPTDHVIVRERKKRLSVGIGTRSRCPLNKFRGMNVTGGS